MQVTISGTTQTYTRAGIIYTELTAMSLGKAARLCKEILFTKRNAQSIKLSLNSYILKTYLEEHF